MTDDSSMVIGNANVLEEVVIKSSEQEQDQQDECDSLMPLRVEMMNKPPPEGEEIDNADFENQENMLLNSEEDKDEEDVIENFQEEEEEKIIEHLQVMEEEEVVEVMEEEEKTMEEEEVVEVMEKEEKTMEEEEMEEEEVVEVMEEEKIEDTKEDSVVNNEDVKLLSSSADNEPEKNNSDNSDTTVSGQELKDQKAIGEALKVFASKQEKKTCCSCCNDRRRRKCCTALVRCTCHSKLPNFCKQQSGGDQPASILETNEVLDDGNEIGWKQFGSLANPLIRPILRDFIAITEFILSIISLSLSAASFSLGNDAVYNILHLALAVTATILALIDLVVSLESPEGIKEACKRYKERRNGGTNYTINEKEKDAERNDDDRRGRLKKKCKLYVTKTWDTSRIVIAELILYPLTICDMIELLVGKSYMFSDAAGGISFALFVISFASLFFYVYIVRLAVLLALSIRLNRRRKRIKENCKEMSPQYDQLDKRAAKRGFCFHLFFFFHVLGQMIAQLLMIAAIGMKIIKDNENKLDSDPIHISGLLWFMLAAGYITPVIGILSFFIVTYYWVYEYPVGICVNLLSLLEAPGVSHIILPEKALEEAEKKGQKVTEYLKEADLRKNLRNDFKKLIDKGFCKKLTYPCFHPITVLVCLIYSASQFAFVITAIIGIQSAELGYVIYYIISIILGIIVNIYVFIIAAIWYPICAVLLMSFLVVLALAVRWLVRSLLGKQ